jgi:glycosyltransferase involved in cell wall biosynthesis
MKILLVTDAVGGVWVYSLELARALKPLGIETVLAVMGPSPNAKQREQASGLKLIDTQLPLDWLDTTAEEIEASGIELSDIGARECVDVVQACSAALLARADFDCATVAVQHSCVASWCAAVKGALPYEFGWRRGLVERGLKRADAVVAPSISFADETSRIYGVPVQAVHNGRTRSASSVMQRADFVLTASRLWDDGKNVATLDAAASRIKVPFEAAGPTYGPNGASISLSHMRGLGEVTAERLASLFAARPIYASAALYEPFGLSVLEAAQAGCALVLSDIPTHREMWAGAAIFVPARDDAAFASAIHDLLDDADERQQLGQLARARAQLYTPERMARGMAEIYARVAAPEYAEVRLAGAA